MAQHYPLDFEASDALNLVDAAAKFANGRQAARNNQADRDYKLFHAWLDMSRRNPDRANVTVRKIFNICMGKGAKDIKAIMGSDPYIPIEARREEFKEQAQLQEDQLQHYLKKGGFYNQASTAILMKVVYGTAFTETIPYFELVEQPVLIPQVVAGMQVGMAIGHEQVPRMKIRTRAWAQWEILVDPYATGLEERDQCRFIVKLQLAGKRAIKELAEKGAYPGLDVELLDKQRGGGMGSLGSSDSHFGLQMMQNLGMPSPQLDDDVSVLMRFESPDRFIDVWDGRVVLRDIENPYKHGLINLSRLVHNIDPHTQNSFYGNGEAKVNEIFQMLMGDLFSMAIDNHNFMNHGKTYYAAGKVDKDSLVHTVGNKIPVHVREGDDIRKYILDDYGQGLPPDHYNLLSVTERFMDVGSASFDPSRGEPSSGEQTATEIGFLQRAADIPQEWNARTLEEPWLTDTGVKTFSHINQFQTPEDRVEVLGEEGAAKLMLLTPYDLPGGFNHTFKGADRVVNQVVRQRNLSLLNKSVMGHPNVMQGWWMEKLLTAFEIDDLEDGIIPDQVLFQQQAEQAQQQAAQEEGKAENDNRRSIQRENAKGQPAASSEQKVAKEEAQAASGSQL